MDNIDLLLYPIWSSPGVGEWGEASSTTCAVTGTAKVTGTAEGSVTAEHMYKKTLTLAGEITESNIDLQATKGIKKG